MELLPTAFLIDSLSVYKNLRNDPVVTGLYNCVLKLYTTASANDQLSAVEAYTSMCNALYESEYNGNLADYLFDLVLYDVNVFTNACARGEYDKLSQEIKSAAATDLEALCKLSLVTDGQIKAAFKKKFIHMPELIDILPGYSISHRQYAAGSEWGENIETISRFYQENGTGMYAKYKAFLYDSDRGILPVHNTDPIRISDLKQYEVQRQKIIDNTLGFLEGHPYNNVLLYGDRGTGKSSTVKALLNEYSGQKLRMIEISKRCLADLDKLIQAVQHIPLKFILFIDDLTFNENDDNFGILKAALEGSLSTRPDNVAIYATTNRRHLIKETFSAREGNEVHRADTIDENLSLSDRFGLMVTFTKPNKDSFLAIVRQLAADRGLEIDEQKLTSGAERFALAKGGRTPRLAKQYIDHLEARMKLNLEIL